MYICGCVLVLQLPLYIFYLIQNMVQSQLGGINGVSALLEDVKAYSKLMY